MNRHALIFMLASSLCLNACPTEPTQDPNATPASLPCAALLRAARQDLSQIYSDYFQRQALDRESFQQEACQDLNGDGEPELIVRGSGPWFGHHAHFSVYQAEMREDKKLKAKRLFKAPYLGTGDALSIKDSAQGGWRNLLLSWTEYPLELPSAEPSPMMQASHLSSAEPLSSEDSTGTEPVSSPESNANTQPAAQAPKRTTKPVPSASASPSASLPALGTPESIHAQGAALSEAQQIQKSPAPHVTSSPSSFPDPDILRDSMPDDMRGEVDHLLQSPLPEQSAGTGLPRSSANNSSEPRMNPVDGMAPSLTPRRQSSAKPSPSGIAGLPTGKSREETLEWNGEMYSPSQQGTLVIGDTGSDNESQVRLDFAGPGKIVPYKGVYLNSGKKILLGEPLEAVESAYGKAIRHYPLGEKLRVDVYPGFLVLSEARVVKLISVGGELKEIVAEAFEHPFIKVELLSGQSFGDSLSSLGEKFKLVNAESIGLRRPEMLELSAEGITAQVLGTHIFEARGVAVAAVPQTGKVIVPENLPEDVKSSALENVPSSEKLPKDEVMEQSPSELSLFRILIMQPEWLNAIYKNKSSLASDAKASALKEKAGSMSEPGNLRYVSEDGIRMRKTASTDAPIIVLSSQNMPLKKRNTAQQKKDNYTWQEVELPWGVTAWIATDFLRTAKVLQGKNYSSKRIYPNEANSKVNIREYPTTQAEVVVSTSSEMVRAYPRFVRNDNYVWQYIEIQVNGKYKPGWVVKDFVR